MSLLSLLAGCATTSAARKDDGVIQRILNAAGLPDDFNGPAHLEENGAYLTIVIDASGLHRNAAGQWAWTWLDYDRRLTIPYAPGLTWKHGGKLRFGLRP